MYGIAKISFINIAKCIKLYFLKHQKHIFQNCFTVNLKDVYTIYYEQTDDNMDYPYIIVINSFFQTTDFP